MIAKCNYRYLCVTLCMTKSISISDGIYDDLVALKENEYETFNIVIMRLLKEKGNSK